MARGPSAFVRVGLPMVTMVVGGSVAISYFLQGKFDIKAGSPQTVGVPRNRCVLCRSLQGPCPALGVCERVHGTTQGEPCELLHGEMPNKQISHPRSIYMPPWHAGTLCLAMQANISSICMHSGSSAECTQALTPALLTAGGKQAGFGARSEQADRPPNRACRAAEASGPEQLREQAPAAL